MFIHDPFDKGVDHSCHVVTKNIRVAVNVDFKEPDLRLCTKAYEDASQVL